MKGKSARRCLAETVIAVAIVALGTAGSGRAADPDALWKIVHDKCVPDQEQHGNPKADGELLRHCSVRRSERRQPARELDNA